MRFWIDRYVIWLLVYGALLSHALATADDYVGLLRLFCVWVIPASQTLTLLAFYRYLGRYCGAIQVGGTLLGRWIGRWVVAVAASVAFCLGLQTILPREWTGLAAIPFVAGSIGATAYLLYRILMDIASLLEARDTTQNAP